MNYSILNIGLASVTFKYTLLFQLTAKKSDEKVRQKIMWAIADFNSTSSAWRKIGALSHEIITSKEIEDALK